MVWKIGDKVPVAEFNAQRERDWHLACEKASKELGSFLFQHGHMPSLCMYVYLDENGNYPTKGRVLIKGPDNFELVD